MRRKRAANANVSAAFWSETVNEQEAGNELNLLLYYHSSWRECSSLSLEAFQKI